MRIFFRLLLVAGGLSMAAPAAATTFVVATPAQLLRASEGVIVGTVLRLTSVDDDGTLRTNVELKVEQSLKAEYGPTVTVVELGGTIGSQQRWLIGAPTFRLGERLLLFLRRDVHQQLHTTHLAMGKFTIQRDDQGNDWAVRDLGEAVGLDATSAGLMPAAQVASYALSDLLEQMRAIAETGGGGASAVAGKPAQGSRWQTQFTFSGPPALRWFQADDAEAVLYSIDATGDSRLGPDASVSAAREALAAWSSAPCTNLRLNAGAAAQSAPFAACDGRSQILFNDPFGEVDAPVDCVGVLAIGGVCADANDPRQFNGGRFYPITEGDVVVNDGFENCAFWTETNLAEIITHELGHSLGLGHSSDNSDESDGVLRDATMYYAAHFDGRGGSLRADDEAAICALYPSGLTATLQFRQFALIFDTTGRPQNDRLVVDGQLELDGQSFDPRRDTLILSARVSGISLLRLAVPPDRWRFNRRATRLRFRSGQGHGATMLTLSIESPESIGVHLRASGLDLSLARSENVSLSLAMGGASVSKSVALRSGLRSRLFP